MIVRFPKGIKVDLDNVPEDFETQIKEAFKDYTYGTASDYTYQDKLAFIDQIVEKLHRAGDEWDGVKNLLIEQFDYNISDFSELPDRDDFESIPFMQDCYKRGNDDRKLYYQFPDDRGVVDHHVYDKIMMLEYRAIKAVMEWEGK